MALYGHKFYVNFKLTFFMCIINEDMEKTGSCILIKTRKDYFY